MDTIYQSGIAFILSLQNLGGWLASVMNLFTLTGEENFFMVVMPLVYWAVDPVIGLRMGVLLLVSGGINSMFKLAFHGPRPFWLSTEVKALRFEASFGIPSGHAQNAAAVWGVLAASLQRKWAWIAAGILMLPGRVLTPGPGSSFPNRCAGGMVDRRFIGLDPLTP